MDRTERFRGKMVDGDRIVFNALEGQLRTRPRSAGVTAEWSGTFEFPPDRRQEFEAGKSFQLVLIDGRRGTVRVVPSENDPLGRHLANFHGVGSRR